MHKQVMKRLLLPFLLFAPLSGALPLPPPCPTNRCGALEVQFDFLYLRVSTCDHTYAIEDPRPFSPTETPLRLPEGKSIRVSPDYGLGFRAAVGYLVDGCTKDLTLIYSTLSNADKESKIPDELAAGFWPTYAHPRYMTKTPIFSPDLTDTDPAKVFGDACFAWDAVELQLGRRTLHGCRTTLRGFVSLYYVHLRNRFEAIYQGFEDPGEADPVFLNSRVAFDGKSWGVGPRLGFDLYTRIWCGLGVSGHFGFGLLAGRTESKIFERDIRSNNAETLTDQLLDVFDQGRGLLFPNFSGRLGVNYTYICENFFAFIAEVGYEYTSYINAVRDPTRYNDEKGTRNQLCTNFDTNGVYIQFRVRM